MITAVLAVVATAVIAPVVTVHVMRLRGYRACDLMDEAAERQEENAFERGEIDAEWQKIAVECARLDHRAKRLDAEAGELLDLLAANAVPQESPRARFEYREPSEYLAAERSVLADEREQLTEHANLPHLNAVYGTEHFESAHITPAMQAIFDAARWHQLNGGELTAELIAQREGMPTGAYPAVTATWPGSGDTEAPKVGGEDEQPSPLPPTKPVVPAAVAIRQIALATPALAGKAA